MYCDAAHNQSCLTLPTPLSFLYTFLQHTRNNSSSRCTAVFLLTTSIKKRQRVRVLANDEKLHRAAEFFVLFAFVPLNPTTTFPEPRVAYLRPSKNNCITSHRHSLNLLDLVHSAFSAPNRDKIPGIRPLKSHVHCSCLVPSGTTPGRMLPSAAIENVIFATSDKGCLQPNPQGPS